MGLIVSLAVVAVVGYAVGIAVSIVTQGIAIAAGLQEKFDWKAANKMGVSFAVSAVASGIAGWAQGKELSATKQAAINVGSEWGSQQIQDGKVTNYAALVMAAIPAGAMAGEAKDGVKAAQETDRKARAVLRGVLNLIETSTKRDLNTLDWVTFAANTILTGMSNNPKTAGQGSGAGGANSQANVGSGNTYTNQGQIQWGAVARDALVMTAGALIVNDRMGEEAAANFLGNQFGNMIAGTIQEKQAYRKEQDWARMRFEAHDNFWAGYDAISANGDGVELKGNIEESYSVSPTEKPQSAPVVSENNVASSPFYLGITDNRNLVAPDRQANMVAPSLDYDDGVPRSSEQQRAFKKALDDLQDPRVRAFLDTLAAFESRGTYNVIHSGGGTFDSYATHPRVKIDDSTAAGRYMFVSSTYDGDRKHEGISAQLGLWDFSPTSQDLAAAHLLRSTGATELLLKNDINGAIKAASHQWQAFPEKQDFGVAMTHDFGKLGPARETRNTFEVVTARYNMNLVRQTPVTVNTPSFQTTTWSRLDEYTR